MRWGCLLKVNVPELLLYEGISVYSGYIPRLRRITDKLNKKFSKIKACLVDPASWFLAQTVQFHASLWHMISQNNHKETANGKPESFNLEIFTIFLLHIYKLPADEGFASWMGFLNCCLVIQAHWFEGPMIWVKTLLFCLRVKTIKIRLQLLCPLPQSSLFSLLWVSRNKSQYAQLSLIWPSNSHYQ